MKPLFIAVGLLIGANIAHAADESRVRLKSAATNAAAGVSAANQALTPEMLELADRVYTGRISCESKATVNVQADPKQPGYFNLTGKDSSGKNFRYRMTPVENRTSAIRLEDPKAGAIWLQVSSKSMLINQKIGQRLADECISPEQSERAKWLKENPATDFSDAEDKSK